MSRAPSALRLAERFDLALLARERGKRGTLRFRPIGPGQWLETELYRVLLRVLAVYAQARPGLQTALTQERRLLTQDAGLADVIAALRASFGQAVAYSEQRIDTLFRTEARRFDDRWLEQINRLIGVDLAGVVRSPQVEPAINLATRTNVALIRGLTDDIAKRVEVKLIELVTRGAPAKEIASALSEIAGFGKARAKLIAVDQAASFNGALNEIRQRQGGIERYTWSTSRDRRVRPLHRQREGQVFRWDAPPSDGHPGRPIRCRCTAAPVLELDAPRPLSRASREGLRAVTQALGL